MNGVLFRISTGFLFTLVIVCFCLAQGSPAWVAPRILNTKKMEWVPLPDEPDWYEKLLAEDPGTGAKMRILYIPPGWIDKNRVNERHYTDYREWALVLFGDLPFCSYKDLTDENCQLTIYRAGMYLDRPGRNIHGTEGAKRTAELRLPVSKTGYSSLGWRERKGKVNYVHQLPPESVSNMDKNQFTQPRHLQTDEMDWLPHPTLKGWLIKPLSDDATIKVSILYMPAAWVDRLNLGKQVNVKNHEFWYVLTGEMPLWYYQTPDQKQPEVATLRDGYFVDLAPGVVLGAGSQASSRTGCSFLQVVRYDLK